MEELKTEDPKRRKYVKKPSVVMAIEPYKKEEKIANLSEGKPPIYDLLPDGFLKEYVDFLYPLSEASIQYHIGAALLLVGASCKRNIYLSFPPGKLFLNLYVLLVGKSGIARKSTATRPAFEMLNKVDPFAYVGNETSLAGFFRELLEYPNRLGYYSEFKTLMDNCRKGHGIGLKEVITDLWDNPSIYKISLKNIKPEDRFIHKPSLSILGATTIDWLKLNNSDITGGFFGRFLPVVAMDEKDRFLPMPPKADDEKYECLVEWLKKISLMKGEFEITAEARELITEIYGKIWEEYGMIIQPRAAKSLGEQRRRTKDRAEVFTPLKIVDKINKAVDVSGQDRMPNKKNWKKYVQELKLEISCGEAPFIVSRYNPTAHTGKLIKLVNRVGFLDRKLKVVSKYCHEKKEWLFWAKEAFKASYGYEWQGDNVLIARENLLYTLIDYYKAQFERPPTLKMQEEFAEIISWNIFQMDGLKYVVPMSCHHETKVIPGETTLFETTPDTVEKHECEGCKYNQPNRHNGIYVKIMDWNKNKNVRFADLVKF